MDLKKTKKEKVAQEGEDIISESDGDEYDKQQL